MKFLTIASLATLAAADVSTVICPTCKPASSTPDVVTRAPLPTSSCTAPKLTIVPVSGGGSVTTITTVYTITSCAPTVTNCPVGSKTTQVMTMPVGTKPSGGNSGAPSQPTTVPITGAGARLGASAAALAGAVLVALAL